eukprot:CAMPEP_0171939810 /NCGR_PEP_ID=MMETSP0993-20121228/36618_1 /TAXON_ID=483369 /ORGANISM="non described non described, Strain CCMP2098" /LENGTH=401 /DNA_ID=CAMNT_0012581727 /DNA_START=16 /DNA_END=1217 /DNA_ORIENTATION=-
MKRAADEEGDEGISKRANVDYGDIESADAGSSEAEIVAPESVGDEAAAASAAFVDETSTEDAASPAEDATPAMPSNVNGGQKSEGLKSIDQTFKIFVGGIDARVTTPELQTHFEAFGVVIDCVVMVDRMSGRSRGFGFATMETQEGFTAAMEHKSHELYGKWMDLKPAEPQGGRPQPSGGGGGGSAGGGNAGTKNLHVSNLSPTTTKDAVIALFEVHASLKEVSMKEGFCFVNTANRDDAARALQALHGCELDGRKLSINFAKDPDAPMPSPTSAASSYNQQQQQQQPFRGGGCGGGGGGPGHHSSSGPPPHMQQQRQPQQSPTAQMLLSSQWVSMSAAFAENHVGDGDGRLWEYVGTDGQVHGPFGSPQMNLWRAHGFFNSEQNLHLRLTNPPPQGGGGG